VVWSPLDTHMTEFGGLWPGYVSGAHHGVTPQGYGHPFLKAGDMTRGHIYALAMYNNFRTNFINVHPGESLLRYSFSSHQGGWQSASPWKFGWGALQPPAVVWMKGPKQGRLKQDASFIQLDVSNVILVAMKKAEDEHGFILRLIEVEGKQTDLKLTAPHFSILHAFETTPVEEDLRMLPCTEHEVSAAVGPFAIKTIRILLKE
jgi:alpha-mannosidase